MHVVGGLEFATFMRSLRKEHEAFADLRKRLERDRQLEGRSSTLGEFLILSIERACHRITILSRKLHLLKRMRILTFTLEDLSYKSNGLRFQVELLLLGPAAILHNLLDRVFERWAEFLLLIFVLWDMVAEFPGGIPPLCTTMPWTIWPSLVVLWGVCWMFAVYSMPPEWAWPGDESFDFLDSLYNRLDHMSPDPINWDAYLVASPVIARDIDIAVAPLNHIINDLVTPARVPQEGFEGRNIRPIESEVVAPREQTSATAPEFSVLQGRRVTAEPEANSQDATQCDDTPGVSFTNDSGQDATADESPARFICPTCGQSYGRPASLNRHIKAKHASVTFTCSFCPKTYDRRDNMKRHEKTHGEVVQESPISGPSAPRAARRQASATTRPVGISRPPTGGRAHTRGHGQQGSAQMSPAQLQRAMQLMGELFLIISGNNP
ncbi:hypothetical protein F5X68DRAFT_24316 [Plectosphaerella plurivora]|uniref:C2H2-type domain-containing protein n=1 Tax=Plectosphaerella plurivora TaxID=936078 RepID=A0A9P8V7P7_9PEZI|nr:hypothetical protein F5X68DRAFT_24316 [Plectosphaerella plurivora]